MGERCRLCERVVPETAITRHHLEPQNRKESDTVWLCRPCHDQVHALFTNHELRHEYDSLDALASAPEVETFVSWIRNTDRLSVQVDDSEDVRRWRE